MTSRKPPGAVKLAPHRPQPSGAAKIPWLICARCGLVYLRNVETQAAIRRGCWVFEGDGQ